MSIQCKGRTLRQAAVLGKNGRLLAAIRIIEIQVPIIAESLRGL